MGRANLLMHTKYTRWWHNAFILYMPPHMSWTKQFQRRDTYSHWTHLIDFPFFKSAALSTNLQTWPPKKLETSNSFWMFFGWLRPPMAEENINIHMAPLISIVLRGMSLRWLRCLFPQPTSDTAFSIFSPWQMRFSPGPNIYMGHPTPVEHWRKGTIRKPQKTHQWNRCEVSFDAMSMSMTWLWWYFQANVD